MRKFMFLVGVAAMFLSTSCLRNTGSYGESSAQFTGTLTTTDTEKNEVSYVDDEASVTVHIPNIVEPKLNIHFNGIKFVPMMPKLNIEIPNIPFKQTISEDETSINYIFDATDIIPNVGSVAYEKYKIDRVWGCVGKSVEINFTMSSKDSQVHFTTAKPESEGDK